MIHKPGIASFTLDLKSDVSASPKLFTKLIWRSFEKNGSVEFNLFKNGSSVVAVVNDDTEDGVDDASKTVLSPNNQSSP